MSNRGGRARSSSCALRDAAHRLICSTQTSMRHAQEPALGRSATALSPARRYWARAGQPKFVGRGTAYARPRAGFDRGDATICTETVGGTSPLCD